MMENAEEQAAIFGALADPTRLKLLKLLCSQREPDALCVNALAGLLGITQPAVSQHLRVLKSAGLVTGKRMGYHVHHSVAPGAIERCQRIMGDALSIDSSAEQKTCRDCNEREIENVSEG
jgi:DNA-binding transcriptional ArsR family regulator